MNEADFDQAAEKVKEKEEAISSCSTANSQDIQAITEMQRDLEKMMPKDKAIMSPIEQEFLDFVYWEDLQFNKFKKLILKSYWNVSNYGYNIFISFTFALYLFIL